MNSLYKYLYIFRIAVINGLEYRMNFVLSLFSAVFPILIQFFLWRAVFVLSAESLQFGYDYKSMVSYIIIAGFVAKFIACGFEWEINQDIKDGKLNNYIIKPIGYMYYRVWNFFGGKVTQFFILILVFGGLGLFNASVRHVLRVQNVLLFIIAILFAMTLNFLMFYCVATIAFWLHEIWGIFIIVNLIFTFISGGIFPLDVFGKVFMWAVKWLPFKYIVYFPVNLLIGQLQENSIIEGLAISFVWIILLYFLSKLLWHNGMKNYISVGG